MNDFPSMLKYLRESEHLSQRELASKIGISSSTIGMYESGERLPKREIEEALADYFNVDLNTLRGKRTPEADPERVAKALMFYDAYENADPDNRLIVDTALKQTLQKP